jgi:hypothetical protein
MLTAQLLIVDFKSLFNAQAPSSLQTCQLRFQVRNLGVTSQQCSQVHPNV